MAETRKVLGQYSLPATTLTDVYTVPSSTQVVNSSIFVCNTTSTNKTFRISIAVAGATNSNEQYLYYDQILPKNTTFVFTTGITLNETDVVRAYASDTGISINIFGVEIT